MINEIHLPRRDLPIQTIIDRMRHDRCGGKPAKVELLTGVEGVSSGPLRRIVLKSPPGNGRDRPAG